MNIAIANFGNKISTLYSRQPVATADPHLSAITELPVTHTENFDIVENERRTYKNHTFSARKTALVNKFPADTFNTHMNE